MLSEHFSLEEMTATQVRGVDNTPDSAALQHLAVTAAGMELVRKLLGDRPIHVNSGYRSLLVNKIVGGSIGSAHLRGWAADFICPAFGSPLQIAQAIAGSALTFDQLIWEEETWVHCSFEPPLRRQLLTKRRHGGFVAGLIAPAKTEVG